MVVWWLERKAAWFCRCRDIYAPPLRIFTPPNQPHPVLASTPLLSHLPHTNYVQLTKKKLPAHPSTKKVYGTKIHLCEQGAVVGSNLIRKPPRHCLLAASIAYIPKVYIYIYDLLHCISFQLHSLYTFFVMPALARRFAFSVRVSCRVLLSSCICILVLYSFKHVLPARGGGGLVRFCGDVLGNQSVVFVALGDLSLSSAAGAITVCLFCL